MFTTTIVSHVVGALVALLMWKILCRFSGLENQLKERYMERPEIPK